jgi:hypothetical protein
MASTRIKNLPLSRKAGENQMITRRPPDGGPAQIRLAGNAATERRREVLKHLAKKPGGGA